MKLFDRAIEAIIMLAALSVAVGAVVVACKEEPPTCTPYVQLLAPGWAENSTAVCGSGMTMTSENLPGGAVKVTCSCPSSASPHGLTGTTDHD